MLFQAHCRNAASVQGLMSKGHQMRKNDELRARAAECVRMSKKTNNPADKTAWLMLAEGWQQMTKPQAQTVERDLSADAQKRGTGQA
jgi:hypothetical protein